MLKRFLPGFALAIATVAVSICSAAAELPQTSEKDGVKVTVIPPDFSSATEAWDFEVTLETHTKALNDDLSKAALLVAEGKQYVPLTWQGSPPGGHHRRGVLRFRQISPHPRAVELRIRLAVDKSPRTFQWLLK